MAYRKPQQHFSFADLAIEIHSDKNRSLSVLKQLDRTIDWSAIAQLLGQFYHTGKQAEGGKAYPPLLLFKCLMLQKWFQIPSDPELESQINDSISFKSFLGLPNIKLHRTIPLSHGFAAACPKSYGAAQQRIAGTI